MSVVGRTYLERGQPVVVLAQWRGTRDVAPNLTDQSWVAEDPPEFVVGLTKRTGPRNVLIRRASGELVVRPMRGLRRSEGSQLRTGRGPNGR